MNPDPREEDIRHLRDEAGKHGDAVAALSAEKQVLHHEIALLRGEAGKRGDAVTALTAEKQALNDEIALLRGEASKRGDAVTALTAEEQALNREIARLQGALEASDERSAVAETRSRELAEELATLRAEHSVLRSTLEQRSHELDDTRTAQTQAEDEAARNTAQVAELEKALAKSTADLAERARAMASQQQRLATLDETATTQARDLARLAQMLIEKEEALKRRNAAAQEAEVRAGAYQHEIAGLRAELEASARTLADSEGRVQELLSSSSWRITAPLRRLSQAFGRKR